MCSSSVIHVCVVHMYAVLYVMNSEAKKVNGEQLINMQ